MLVRGLRNVWVPPTELLARHQKQRALALVRYRDVLAAPLLVVFGAERLALPLEEGDAFARNPVHVFEVAAQVAALGEGLLALRAREGPLSGVLAEVVPEIAALFKNGAAAAVSALEVELHAHCLLVAHLDGLVPVAWDALKRLRFGTS